MLRATSSVGTVNKNSSYSQVSPRVFLCILVSMIYLDVVVYVIFYLGQLSHFPSCFGAGVANLNEPPLSFYAASLLLRVRSWLHFFNKRNVRRGDYLCRWLSATE